MTDMGKIEALFEQALAYQQQGEYDKAIAIYTQLIALKPDHAPAIHNCATAKTAKKMQADADKRAAEAQAELDQFKKKLEKDYDRKLNQYRRMFLEKKPYKKRRETYLRALLGEDDYEKLSKE